MRVIFPNFVEICRFDYLESLTLNPVAEDQIGEQRLLEIRQGLGHNLGGKFFSIIVLDTGLLMLQTLFVYTKSVVFKSNLFVYAKSLVFTSNLNCSFQ